MKKKLIAIIAAVLIIGALGMTACGGGVAAENNTAVAYGIVHKQYAGRVTVTVNSDKTIQDARFEEFLPIHDLGNVAQYGSVAIDAAHKTEVVSGFSKNAETGVVTATMKSMANFIKIGGKMFVLTKIVDAEAGNDASYPLYGYRNADWTDAAKWEIPVANQISNSTDTSAEPNVVHSVKWLAEGVQFAYANPEFSKFYIEAMEKGDFYICKDAAGATTYDIPFTAYSGVKTTKATWANKNVNGYWTRTADQSGLGWRANMEAMRLFLIGKTFDAYTGEEAKGTGGTFLFGTAETGATLTDYHQYMAIAEAAYDKAVEIFA